MSARTEVMDISYPVCLLNTPPTPRTVLTGAAFLPVRANWLRGRGIGRPREDRNTTITDKRRDEGVSVSDV